MDINKAKEASKINYNKKELELIYWQAKARDINKKELKDIKKALYEIVPIGQYSPDFKDLIRILKTLPDKALKSIEQGEFINLYTKIAEIQKYYKGNFSNCNNILLLLYTDYNNINNIREFTRLSESMWYLNYIGYKEEISDIIFNINPNLAYVLEDAKRFHDLGPHRYIGKGDIIASKYIKLFNYLQITFLMNNKLFDNKYNFPADIVLFLYENINTTYETVIKSFEESNDKYQFSKLLLLEFYNIKDNELNNPLQEHLTKKLSK